MCRIYFLVFKETPRFLGETAVCSRGRLRRLPGLVPATGAAVPDPWGCCPALRK